VKIELVGEVDSSRAHSGPVTAVVVVPDKKKRFTVLSSSLDRTLGAWNPGTRNPPRQVMLSGPAQVLAASRDGSLVATASADKQQQQSPAVQLWDGHSLESKGASLAGHSRFIWALAVSADGAQLLSAAAGETWLWNLKELNYRVLEGHDVQAKVFSTAFNATGKLALSGDDEGSLILWDATSAKLLSKMQAGISGKAVRTVAFTPDGFISAGDDGVIRIWNGETFKSRELPTQAAPVRAIAVSNDGKRLLSAGDDGNIRLWSLSEGNVIHTFTGHKGLVRGVAFSPDAREAVSGGEDGSVRLWRLPFE
jgi:WD40 repeat protein